MKPLLYTMVLMMMAGAAVSQPSALRVAVSRGGPEDKYQAYCRWLQQAGNGVECVDLWGLGVQEAAARLAACSALMLTGGEDVDPAYYGKPGELHRCGRIDAYRDSLEMALIGRALALKLPIMAICRGAQILNVSQGGTLVVDIPADRPSALCHNKEKPEVCFHEVIVEPGGQLDTLLGRDRGRVNSYHHQAVDRLAEPFTVTARASDGLIEAYTWKDPSKPLLIAVQWHPERIMEDEDFSRRLAGVFLESLIIKR